MSRVERPVTQIAEIAVNNASASGVTSPDLLEMGKLSNTVQTSARLVNATMAKRAGVECTRAENHDCRVREEGVLPARACELNSSFFRLNGK